MKSQTFPESVPAEFAKFEQTDKAYRIGWNRGHGIACHNVPTLGETVLSDSLGRVKVDADNIREVHEAACFEVEMNARDFSPFEFYAAEFNGMPSEFEDNGNPDLPTSEECWEAYEAGVRDSIGADLATYEDDDYGIAEETD